jgi:hypothetical protein
MAFPESALQLLQVRKPDAIGVKIFRQLCVHRPMVDAKEVGLAQ